jgi:hypothetical protein
MRNECVCSLLVLLVSSWARAAAADEVVKLDDLDADDNLISTTWSSGFDKNGLGTVLAPEPFRPSDGGSPASPKRFARISGHFGKNKPPYPWAQMSLPLDPAGKALDLSMFRAIRFNAKGSGRAKIIVGREGVKDFADYASSFALTDQWTEVVVPLSELRQPNWGKAVPVAWNDVKGLRFEPEGSDVDFDIGIDDLALLRDPASTAPVPFKVLSVVPTLPVRELAAKKIAYTTVPLGPEARWSFKDEVEGDGKGGWTDQGENSVPEMPTGRRVLEGIPFDIAAKAGQQVIVLRGQSREAFPTRAEVKVDKRGKALYFLHAAAWASGRVGSYTVVYADGQQQPIELRGGVEVFDWWSPGRSKVAIPGWLGKNPVHTPIGLTLFAWENPRPAVAIAKIVAETTGKDAFLMLAGLTLAAEGPYLAANAYSGYPTKTWFAYLGYDIAKRKGTALDMSFLLDAPAGKHGTLKKSEGEDFVFEDGTLARFWGINIVAGNNFPTHVEAEKTAELLAQMGYNMSRHHHMDADWAERNIWGKKDSTLALDAESLDRLDYLIFQLQKRGIYQYLDLLVHRKPSAKDGIEDADQIASGYKTHASWVPRLIELQKKYVEQLLTHKNPYTGKTYGEDPSVVMQEIVNEDSLFYRGNGDDFSIKPGRYTRLWNQLWNAWLVSSFGDAAALAKRWAPATNEAGKKGLLSGEDPKAGTVASIPNWADGSRQQYTRQRILDSYRHDYEVVLRYQRDMTQTVRRFRPRGLLTLSNHWVTAPIDLYINAIHTDFGDRHDYWAHPQGGWAIAAGLTFDPTSMTRNAQGGIVGGLAARRVKGRPYIVGEWQTSAPNDYRQEGLLYMAAMSDFQNWSAVQFETGTISEKSILLTEPFSSTAPKMLAAAPMAALLFHRQDVRRATESVFKPLSDAEVFSPDTTVRLPDGLALAVQTGIEFSGKEARTADLAEAAARHVSGTKVTSCTKELTADWKQGLFRVDAERSQGFTGFARKQRQSFANLEATVENEYALVVLSALDKQPVAESPRLLLTAVGNAVNSGMTVFAPGGRIREPGTLPVLVEPVVGEVRVKLVGNLARLEVWALDPSGQRVTRVPVVRKGATISFKLAAKYRAQHYEIVRG